MAWCRHLCFWWLVVMAFGASAQEATSLWKQTITGASSFCSITDVRDLNGDGIYDIVLGAGKEAEYSAAGILALDGANGAILWAIGTRSQMYGSPVFYDADGDGKDDVLCSGRDAQLICANSSGSKLWEFWPQSKGNASDSGYYNFYSPQLIQDVNGDEVMDIVITNGGDASAGKSDSIRPAGKVMIISGSDGNTVAELEMPDGKETYCSPLLFEYKDTEHVLFGSGGESVRGSLWLIPLQDLKEEKQSGFIEVLSNSIKGFIAVPSVVDVSNDGLEDILVTDMEGRMYAIDGKDLSILWERSTPNSEGYVSPALGFFNEDKTPDVVTTFSFGEFPFYSGHRQVIYDGENGSTLWSSDTGLYPLTSPIVLDLDEDGRSELLAPLNYDSGFSTVQYRSKLEWVNVGTDSRTQMSKTQSGFIIYSMPFADDLDQNGKLDLIVITNRNEKNWYAHDSFTVERLELDVLPSVTWPSYMGDKGKGRMRPLTNESTVRSTETKTNRWYPNPTKDLVSWRGYSSEDIVEVLDMHGAVVAFERTLDGIDLGNLTTGMYVVRVSNGQNTLVFRCMKI